MLSSINPHARTRTHANLQARISCAVSHRRLLASLTTLCALAAILAFSASPASASGFSLVSSFTGEFGAASPNGVAVDDSTGDVFVLDAAKTRLEVFNPEGVKLPEFKFTGGGLAEHPQGVAVDDSTAAGDTSRGDVYVADPTKEAVDRFKALGGGSYELQGPLYAAEPHGVAVDSKGDLYIANYFLPSGVLEYNYEGKELPPIEDASFSQLKGVAAAPSAGVIYVLNEFGASLVKLTLSTENKVEQEETIGHGGAAVAVDPAGSVFVVRNEPVPHVEEYEPNGTLVEEFGAGEMGVSHGIAYSSSNGDVYVADEGNHAVHIFAKTEEKEPRIKCTSPEQSTPVAEVVKCTITSEAATAAWSVKYGEGTELTTETAGGTVNGTEAVEKTIEGLKPSRKYSYQLFAENNEGTKFYSAVETFGTIPAVKKVSQCTVSEVGPTTATLNGSVEPNAGAATTWFFEYAQKGSSEFTRAPQPSPTVPSTEEPHSVKAPIESLQPRTPYACRLVATAEYDGTPYPVEGESGEFTTAGPPIPGEQFVSAVGTTTATLNAQIDPEGPPGEWLKATFDFEYGEVGSPAPMTKAPSEPASLAAENDVLGSTTLSGLKADTEYRYRIVVEDKDGTTQGAEETFDTYPTSLPSLPDGRAYEMVTPPENENADVYQPDELPSLAGADGTQTGLPFRAAVDGSAVAYVADPTSGGNGSSGEGKGNQYLARRSAQGKWEQQNIQPSGLYSPEYLSFSNDLSLAILQSSESLPGAPGGGIYATAPGSNSYQLLGGTYAGANTGTATVPAASHILAGGDMTGGQQFPVNVLPDRELAPNFTFGAPSTEPTNKETFPDLSHVISADGSRIFWTDLSPGEDFEHVYVRQNDETTNAVSAGAARYWTASPDGRYAFYTEAGALYRFDVPSETREEVAPASAGVQGVIGTNETGEDGSYVYFAATAALSGANPEGKVPTAGQSNLYLRHHNGSEWEAPAFIATLVPQDETEVPPFRPNIIPGGDLLPGLGNRTAAVAPDGRSVVFMSRRSLTNYDNNAVRRNTNDELEPDPSNPELSEVYVYQSEESRLFCASCNPSGEPPLTIGVPNPSGKPAGFLPLSHSATFAPRWISTDGSRVFFDSTQALVPQDQNGMPDVYEWENDGSGSCHESRGCVYLLSAGTSPTASWLLDASESGGDIFIITAAQLAGKDHNENYDVYDARVGGGTEVQPTQCSGSGCQVPSPPPPSFATPSSETFAGAGNLAHHAALSHCKRGFVKKHGRCAKKKAKHTKRKGVGR